MAVLGTATPEFYFGRGEMSGGWVYIMTNKPNGTIYVGVTISTIVYRENSWVAVPSTAMTGFLSPN